MPRAPQQRATIYTKLVAAIPRIDIDQPKYDQSTYINRAKHFFLLTNPLNLLASNAKLERARRIVHNYRAGKEVPEVQSVDDLWRAKYLYDSAFHPETGEKSILIGRMSAQMPMNMIITGAMLTFYKSTAAVVFWHWYNQTFNAVVNYTNRSGKSTVSNGQLMASYVGATGGAVATALGLNRLVQNLPPLVGRLVPFTAVAAGNCINIPIMRIQEIQHGVALVDEKNNVLGYSKRAAIEGIAAVTVSRIFMAIPSMTLIPILVQHLDKRGFFKRYPWANAPIQTLACGVILIFATPMGCAFFKQRASITVSRLEPAVREQIRKEYPGVTEVWYNKGL